MVEPDCEGEALFAATWFAEEAMDRVAKATAKALMRSIEHGAYEKWRARVGSNQAPSTSPSNDAVSTEEV